MFGKSTTIDEYLLTSDVVLVITVLSEEIETSHTF